MADLLQDAGSQAAKEVVEITEAEILSAVARGGDVNLTSG